MREGHSYKRLEFYADMIGRHPPYKGKETVERECLDEIDRSVRLGLITEGEKEKLLQILAPVLKL